MKKHYSVLIAMFLLFVAANTFTACGGDEVDDTTQGTLVIKNNSIYSLQRFAIRFINSRGETISDIDKGTFEPGSSQKCTIPIGATEYYMRTLLGGTYFFSPNYEVSIKKITLDNSTVGAWTSN